jgi:hypothetical protein
MQHVDTVKDETDHASSDTRITYPSARCALVTSNELHTPVGVDGTASN